MFLQTLVFILCSGVASAEGTQLEVRDSCDKNFRLCSPEGASSTATPVVGNGLSEIFVDLVHSVHDVPKHKRDDEETVHVFHPRSSKVDLCCAVGTKCLLLQELHLPFCYDTFTTNFLLPGGASGTIYTGNYTSPNGDVANIRGGNYRLANGTTGNLYGSPPSVSVPDTATLAIPTQYTASGVGSAIPLTALGREVTYTTTIPGTTIEATTIPAQTLAPSIVSGSTVAPGTTKPATTIPGTTLSPQTSTVTTTMAQLSSTRSGAVSFAISGIINRGAIAGICIVWIIAIL